MSDRPVLLRPRLSETGPYRSAVLAALKSGGEASISDALLDPGEDPAALAAAVTVLALRDAAADGWRLAWDDGSGVLRATPPGSLDAPPEVQKARVQASLVRARDARHDDPATRRFVARVEAVRTRRGVRASVRDLFLAPDALADAVSRVRAAPEADRERLAADLVDPYVQLCEADAHDEHTGLRLLDVWRYARATWSLPHASVPGRRMHVLVRDASRPFHPVVAIGALASSAVQISVRDRAVGWTPLALAPNDTLAGLLKRGALGHVAQLLNEGNPWRAAEWIDGDRTLPPRPPQTDRDGNPTPDPDPVLGEGDDEPDDEAVLAARERLLRAEFGIDPADVVAHLLGIIETRARALYTDDLLNDPELSNHKFGQPNERTLERLAEIRDQLALASRILGAPATDDLVRDARSPRYTRKRVVELYKLLKARRLIQEARRSQPSPADAARWLLARSSRRLALKAALREVKKDHVAASVMDVTTCGALAPYNQLLGGKLAALLLASPQVVGAYRERYDGAESIIASRMQGRPVHRPADLVLLCTTSLYGVGSSQYNRLRALVGRDPDGTPHEVAYHLAGKTLGYGTVHVAPDTYTAMRALLAAHGLSESDQFGAGVNVKMRRVGAALGLVGLAGLEAHQQSRLVYLAPLARNWRRVLLGLDDTPDYPLDPETGTADVVTAWRERYLVPRVLRTHDGHGDLFDLVSQIREEHGLHAETEDVQGVLFA